MKSKSPPKLISINIGITIETSSSKRQVSAVFPSVSVPTIKAILDVMIQAVNESCDTDYIIKSSEKQLKKELGYVE